MNSGREEMPFEEPAPEAGRVHRGDVFDVIAVVVGTAGDYRVFLPVARVGNGSGFAGACVDEVDLGRVRLEGGDEENSVAALYDLHVQECSTDPDE